MCFEDSSCLGLSPIAPGVWRLFSLQTTAKHRFFPTHLCAHFSASPSPQAYLHNCTQKKSSHCRRQARQHLALAYPSGTCTPRLPLRPSLPGCEPTQVSWALSLAGISFLKLTQLHTVLSVAAHTGVYPTLTQPKYPKLSGESVSCSLGSLGLCPHPKGFVTPSQKLQGLVLGVALPARPSGAPLASSHS